ncbi:MAG: AAA family ATPase [Puniceicoccales bacterium]|jgi:predicted AAA+ superfamily ATPase|nr:AAA family ATPase [Puniceicoccales bacterium]
MKFIKRWQEQTVRLALQERRVVILSGARQVGKTTLAKRIAGGDATYRTLDDAKMLQTAKSDPGAFVRSGRSLTIIDEIQRAPELLSAIKMVVDGDTRYGQFLLAGSANVQTLPTVSESLAGRV